MPSTNRLEMGLSPRVRGNRSPGSEVEFLAGSIPACAGEPGAVPVGCRRLRVYPRVCGGTEAATVSSMTSLGLSPRVRGNPGQPAGFRFEQGSIPACAGEPAHRRRAGRVERVYPRVCGGTFADTYSCSSFMGLSPRVRGNRLTAHQKPTIGGSIPACAGEPLRCGARPSPRWVYPRVCGGTFYIDSDTDEVKGLSPRVRGNLMMQRASDGGRGLSPRVRGNQLLPDLGWPDAGSIPACAGEP